MLLSKISDIIKKIAVKNCGNIASGPKNSVIINLIRAVGCILATLSARTISSAIYYPLSYVISMPLTFLVDVIIYKEKITINNVLGIILVTLSGVLINF